MGSAKTSLYLEPADFEAEVSGGRLGISQDAGLGRPLDLGFALTHIPYIQAAEMVSAPGAAGDSGDLALSQAP